MNKFESVEFLEPGHTYLRLVRRTWRADDTEEFIGPFDPRLTLNGSLLYMGDVYVGGMREDAGGWMIEVGGKLWEYDIVEVVTIPHGGWDD